MFMQRRSQLDESEKWAYVFRFLMCCRRSLRSYEGLRAVYNIRGSSGLHWKGNITPILPVQCCELQRRAFARNVDVVFSGIFGIGIFQLNPSSSAAFWCHGYHLRWHRPFEQYFVPVGRIMNSCMASLFPAWLPPLITLNALKYAMIYKTVIDGYQM
jgi:hypothetical protein